MTSHRILQLNAVSTAACGLGLLAGRGTLYVLFGLDTPTLLDVIAVGLLAYAGMLAAAALQRPVSRPVLMAFTAADVLWVAASALVLLLFWAAARRRRALPDHRRRGCRRGLRHAAVPRGQERPRNGAAGVTVWERPPLPRVACACCARAAAGYDGSCGPSCWRRTSRCDRRDRAAGRCHSASARDVSVRRRSDAGRRAGDARPARALQRRRDRTLPAGHPPHVCGRPVHRARPRAPASPRRRGQCAGPAGHAEPRGGGAALPWRGRSRVRSLGRGAARRDHALRRLGRGEALRERFGELHGTAVRGGHHGPGVDAAGDRVRRSRACAASRASAAQRPRPGGSRS